MYIVPLRASRAGNNSPQKEFVGNRIPTVAAVDNCLARYFVEKVSGTISSGLKEIVWNPTGISDMNKFPKVIKYYIIKLNSVNT